MYVFVCVSVCVCVCEYMCVYVCVCYKESKVFEWQSTQKKPRLLYRSLEESKKKLSSVKITFSHFLLQSHLSLSLILSNWFEATLNLFFFPT